jgi:dihydroorotase
MLLKKTKGKLHIAHVSCKESVELIKRAKEEGLNITSEVTPHHLVLTEQEIKNYNTNAKVFPPLRLEEDREALFEGLKEGIIDVIATDHAPHRLQDKEVEFDYASPGISGLETAFSIITTFFYHKGKLSLKDISRVMSYNPARIFNIEKMGEIKEGFYGNVVIVDINREWVCDPLNFISKGKNTPFKGYKLKGEVIYTIYKGKITYNGGKKI